MAGISPLTLPWLTVVKCEFVNVLQVGGFSYNFFPATQNQGRDLENPRIRQNFYYASGILSLEMF